MLKRDKAEYIRDAVIKIINNNKYKENVKNIAKSFHNAGGSKRAAHAILEIIDKNK